MIVLQVFLCMLFGYLVGGINPSYIIGRLRGFDIRKKGSGNAGASNAMITMGKAIGIGSAIFDILKATAVVLVAPLLFKSLSEGNFPVREIAGTACILGHIFPVYMKFRGGKGLACLGGVILGLDWRLALIMLSVELVLVLWVDYICIVPITASIALPIIYGVFGGGIFDWLLLGKSGYVGAAVLAVATVGILSRHIENLRRIREGKELHFSYLWKRDKQAEISRVMGDQEQK